MRQRTRAGSDLTEPTTSPRQRVSCRGSTAAAMPKLAATRPASPWTPRSSRGVTEGREKPRGDRREGPRRDGEKEPRDDSQLTRGGHVPSDRMLR